MRSNVPLDCVWAIFKKKFLYDLDGMFGEADGLKLWQAVLAEAAITHVFIKNPSIFIKNREPRRGNLHDRMMSTGLCYPES